MEYKTDKRTKNLTLRDIHVGDWVQVWRAEEERYSPPLKITQICVEGTVHLVSKDEDRGTPSEWVESIKNIDALPITAGVLLGFGFEKSGDFYSFKNSVFAIDKQLGVMDVIYIDKYGESTELEDIEYMHELQQTLSEERNFIGNFKIKWKGIEK